MSYSAFTYRQYHVLLAAAARAGRSLVTVARCLESKTASAASKSIVLRHDVDRWTAQAVRMAVFEHSLGVRATYYFRSDRLGRFPARCIERVHGLGHECGYHYETLSHCRGDRVRAIEVFARNLEAFRKIVPCETVSAHGAPLSRHDNIRLLFDEDPARFGLAGDAVHSFRRQPMVYFTDSGGAWNASSRRNIRDRFFDESMNGLPLPTSGPAFERILTENPSLVYLTIHPERWAGTASLAMICGARDLVGLGIKATASMLRRIGGTGQAKS